MSGDEVKKPGEDDSRFSMKHVAEDLDSIAGEEAALQRGVAKSYDAIKNTVEADASGSTEPMRMWVNDLDVGGRMPLLPELMMGLGGNISASIEQKTDDTHSFFEAVAERLKAEQGQPPDDGGYQFKYVRDPDTKGVVGISTDYRLRSYSLRDQEDLGVPAKEVVLNSVSFNRDTALEDRQGVMDAPYRVTFTEDGYFANFALGNFKLELNDPRNPRNWEPQRMGQYIEKQLIPLCELPALRQNSRGDLEREIEEDESDIDRIHNIAHMAKRSVESIKDVVDFQQNRRDEAMRDLKGLVSEQEAEMEDYIRRSEDGEIDWEETLEALRKWPDGVKQLADQNKIAQEKEYANRPEAVKEAMRLAQLALDSSKTAIEYQELMTKRLDQAEESYDDGYSIR